MYKLEHGSNDKQTAESEKPRLAKLFHRNEDTWADNYTANQKLRAAFRKRNFELKQSSHDDQKLLTKSSLDIPLLAERDEDRKIAKLLSMKPNKSINEATENKRKEIISQSSLPTTNFTKKTEERAIKILSKPKLNLGVIKKRVIDAQIAESSSKIRKTSSLVSDYGGSSESD